MRERDRRARGRSRLSHGGKRGPLFTRGDGQLVRHVLRMGYRHGVAHATVLFVSTYYGAGGLASRPSTSTAKGGLGGSKGSIGADRNFSDRGIWGDHTARAIVGTWTTRAQFCQLPVATSQGKRGCPPSAVRLRHWPMCKVAPATRAPQPRSFLVSAVASACGGPGGPGTVYMSRAEGWRIYPHKQATRFQIGREMSPLAPGGSAE